MPTVEARLTHLERQNRTLRASILLVVMTLVTCGGNSVTANYKRVNTNALVVVTGDEQPVISLSADGKITFADPSGSVVLDANTVAKLLAASQPSPRSGS